MKELLKQRHQELQIEFENGQKLLAELESRQANLRNSLLRISGAIQVLEELLHQPSDGEPCATSHKVPEMQGCIGAQESAGK
jgi:hypothetical protein